MILSNPSPEPDWKTRLFQAEAQTEQLREEIAQLRAEWQQQIEAETNRQAEQNTLLKEAILRYAVACGAVDVQVAMLRARGENREDAIESLHRSMEEQADASAALRALARSL